MSYSSRIENGLLLSGEGVKGLTPKLLHAALASAGIRSSVELRPVKAIVSDELVELINDTPVEFNDPRYVAYVDFTAFMRDNPEILERLGADTRGGFDNDVWQAVHRLFSAMEQESFYLCESGKVTQEYEREENMTHEFMVRQDGSLREKARKVPRDYFVAHGTHNILEVSSLNLYTLQELLEWIDKQGLENLLDPEDDRPKVREQSIEFLREFIPAKMEEAKVRFLPPL